MTGAVAGLLVLGGGGALAGLFGSLLGLGGGILVVPFLSLGLGLPLREAVAVSLVSVIVTSVASSAVYLQRHVANLRLGMVLELGTAAGALAGGLVAFLLAERVLAGLFAALLAWTAVSMVRRREPAAAPVTDGDAPAAAPAGFAATLGGPGYRVRRLPAGMMASVGAGTLSALLGVGGGIVKVPAMHLLMGVPLRVAAATSNLMIGVTATASAVIYLLRDALDPYVAGPVALGAFAGAAAGSRVAHRVPQRVLRWLFVAVLAWTAVQMARRAVL